VDRGIGAREVLWEMAVNAQRTETALVNQIYGGVAAGPASIET
jgi:hypothetical protein